MSDTPHNRLFRKADCPWGKKAHDLLEEQGVEFQDNVFADETEELAFKRKHSVDSTPQVFIEGERIGGYEALAEHFGVEAQAPEERSYVPVVAVFGVALLMAIATSGGIKGFMGFALCLLACLKLMDLQSFVERFAEYDLLTRVYRPYARFYPFAELGVGIGLLGGLLPGLTGTLALLVGVAGGLSILKAVYLDKADLNCACVGGNSPVPLGLVSFSENAIMALMGAALLLGWA